MCESVVRNTKGEQVLGNEVTDTLIKEGCKAVVVVVPMMFVSENHGCVTVCHSDDFVSCGSAAALDEVDRVLTAHFHTKTCHESDRQRLVERSLKESTWAEQPDGALKVSNGSQTANTLKTWLNCAD